MILPLRATAWNLFLALIPVAAAYLLAALVEQHRGRGKPVPWYVWLPFGIVWLAFLPNSCYLVTEWRHFLFDSFPVTLHNADSPRGLLLDVGRDGFFYLVYSLAGVVCFTLSIRPIEHMLRKAGRSPVLLASPFFFLVSLGVYMGLIVRLNSWDIATRPRHVLGVALRTLMDPVLMKAVIIFAALLFLLYELFDIFFDGLILRLQRWGVIRPAARPEVLPSDLENSPFSS